MTTTTRLEQSVATACEQGAMCVHDRSGHGLSAIQHRLALATPSAFLDAIVADAEADGWITLHLVDTGAAVRVWNHSDLTEVLAAGDPVALHSRYDVVVAGGAALNVAR